MSGFSSLYFWNVPYLDEVLENQTIEWGIDEYTVTTEAKRYRKKGEKIHLCTIPLPEGSVVEVDGKSIASPEMAFLQVANRLDILDLILLGMQLCSHPPGHPEKALTTKEKLTHFISNAIKHRGRRKAMRAVKYIKNGSYSFMESLLYISLTAPHILGGYSLKGASLNHEIILNEEFAKLLKQNRCYLDIYYEDKKIDIEYDSSAHHSTTDQQKKDFRRGRVLRMQGYVVFNLTTNIFYSVKNFRKFVRTIARRLGKRIRITNKSKFEAMHKALRNRFPRLKGKEVCA